METAPNPAPPEDLVEAIQSVQDFVDEHGFAGLGELVRFLRGVVSGEEPTPDMIGHLPALFMVESGVENDDLKLQGLRAVYEAWTGERARTRLFVAEALRWQLGLGLPRPHPERALEIALEQALPKRTAHQVTCCIKLACVLVAAGAGEDPRDTAETLAVGLRLEYTEGERFRRLRQAFARTLRVPGEPAIESHDQESFRNAVLTRAARWGYSVRRLRSLLGQDAPGLEIERAVAAAEVRAPDERRSGG